ncbi:hypothetical protein GCM10010272_66030 [Streptomyces lateritius]|nr:hypothetical protein GCM10010272_66030 [Streptomyces lateritius]
MVPRGRRSPGSSTGCRWTTSPRWSSESKGRSPADLAAYEGRLPVECELYDLPVGSIEDAFMAAIGQSVALERDQLGEPVLAARA